MALSWLDGLLTQNIHEQVNVVAADRMRIVKMDTDMAAKQDSREEKK